MEIHLLGTIGLAVDGTPLTIRSHKVRILLAGLALDLGKPLSPAVLADRIWDGEPPVSATSTLQSYVSRLRTVLREAAAGAPARPGTRIEIVSQAGTYALQARPEQVDWHHFRTLAGRARTLAEAGQDHRAWTLLREAEDVWQGEPLAGLPGEWAQSTRVLLADRKLAATLTRIEIELRLGRFADVVAELIALAADHPWNERVSALLMTALYGCDRLAEALSVYRDVRRRLREDLGTGPAESLNRLNEQLLHRVPVGNLLRRPAAAAAGRSAAHGASAPPSTLRSAPELIGRESELNAVLDAARNPDRAGGGRPAPLTVVTVSGMPGAGKTGLALAAAALLREEFPDGQVFVPLAAHAGGTSALGPETAATALLRQFGVPAQQIPLDPEELLAECRELLADRRALVVLDDAAGPAQVRPLLPAASPSFVLVTSRHRMAELPAVRTVLLTRLSPSASRAMFRRLAGGSRIAEPEQAAEMTAVAELCSGHPLALDLAASRFRAHPTWTLEHLIRRLSRADGRIGELWNDLGSLEGAFMMSYQTLAADHQTAFRRLCLYPGGEFGPHTAAALVGLPVAATERIIDALLTVHLASEPSPGRYEIHDLISEFGRILANRTDPPEDHSRTVRRLSAFATDALVALDHARSPRRFRLPPPAGLPDFAEGAPPGTPEWSDEASATSWLRRELPGFIALEGKLRADGDISEAGWLSHVLAPHLDTAGLWHEAHRMQEAAATAGPAQDDPRRAAHALLDLARTLIRFARYPDAADVAERALGLARRTGDDPAHADALSRLAELHGQIGDPATALTYQHAAVTLRRSIGDEGPLARSLNNQGVFHTLLGDQESAVRSLREALPIFRSLGDQRSTGSLLNNLGGIHLSTGDRKSARTSFEALLELDGGNLSEADLAAVRLNLALTLDIPEESRLATELLNSSARTFGLLGDVRHEIDARNALGLVHRLSGNLPEAHRQYSTAAGLAARIGAAHEEQEARQGLEQVEDVIGTTPCDEGGGEQSSDRSRLARAEEATAPDLGDLTESLLRRDWPDLAEAPIPKQMNSRSAQGDQN
ncbi:BTAD domain-containing putative transcriptional regulator [Kitasatospora cineracea]